MNDKNTRERLIDAAYEEIYNKGYQGASLADILAKAGVHKGSMYHFFAGKKEMALAAIAEKIDERFAQRYGSLAHQEGEILKAFFERLRDTKLRDFKRGCPIANIVQEMSNLDADFEALMKGLYEQFRANVKRVFDEAIKRGELRECDSAKLALFTVAAIEGAILSAKASGDEADYLNAIDALIEYLQSYKTKG